MPKILHFLYFKTNTISRRKLVILSTPAKLITPILKPSSELSKLTIQSLRMKKKELKEKVIELQQKLSKSSLQVLENLGADLTSIVAD